MALTRVLITVKTYPTLSTKYEELVCTAGFREDGSWIRLYPLQFRQRPYAQQYKKYQWIEIDLVKNEKDFRPESFRPVSHETYITARIAAVIRRRRFDGNKILMLNEILIDTLAKTVQVNNSTVDVTRKEYDLLLYLAANKNRVISKNAIAEHLSGNDANDFDSFDFIYAHIKNLKKKMAQAGCADYIKSIYGMGYKFDI